MLPLKLELFNSIQFKCICVELFTIHIVLRKLCCLRRQFSTCISYKLDQTLSFTGQFYWQVDLFVHATETLGTRHSWNTSRVHFSDVLCFFFNDDFHNSLHWRFMNGGHRLHRNTPMTFLTGFELAVH